MSRAAKRSLAVWALPALLAGAPLLGAELSGDLRAHDPSTVVRCQGKLWCFYTGPGCRSKFSTNGVHWQEGPRVFERLPDWAREVAPRNRGSVWAPDILFRNGRYHLYYSVSEWGKNRSAIGLATSPTLEPTDPAWRWKDEGIVVRSQSTNDFNAIDPGVFQDDDGSLWMVFGSFWSGIKLLELDRVTGRAPGPAPVLRTLAWNPSIEAPCLGKHNGFYYLFVNWDACCRGVDSTYNIRAGRSRLITGPYLDAEGRDLREGGGTLFLGTAGRRIGPGHAGVASWEGRDWFTSHYYDGQDEGRPKLDVRPLEWREGWPVLGSR